MHFLTKHLYLSNWLLENKTSFDLSNFCWELQGITVASLLTAFNEYTQKLYKSARWLWPFSHAIKDLPGASEVHIFAQTALELRGYYFSTSEVNQPFWMLSTTHKNSGNMVFFRGMKIHTSENNLKIWITSLNFLRKHQVSSCLHQGKIQSLKTF